MTPSTNPIQPQQLTALTDQLRDIHLPAEPGLWPPAPGWWLLLLITAMLVIMLVMFLIGRLRQARFERGVLGELTHLERHTSGSELAAGVSALLKRVALARYPRARVAALAGRDWLDFLDRNGGNGRFADGPGRVLADAPFAPPSAPHSDLDPTALVALGKDWIRSNL